MSNQKNENSGEEKTAAGVTPRSVSLHTYKITSVPPGCTAWEKDQLVEVYVSNPPDQEITLDDGDACDGTRATLVS